jgi:CDP-glucose 4,6-dehydratase
LISGKVVEIRNPESTRPWQHVLDPLIGYLRFVEQQNITTKKAHLNFGPLTESITVKDATSILQRTLKPIGEIYIEYALNHQQAMESKTLSLNSEQAMRTLNWSPMIGSAEALEVTANWWINVLKNQLSADESIKKDLYLYFERINEK